MDSVDELRVSNDASDYQWIRSEYLNKIADEVEAEIERDYMWLPRDADDEPIHVGDRVTEPGGLESQVEGVGREEVFLRYKGGMLLNRDSDLVRHVKPRTPEDVLREFANDVLNANRQLISEQGTEAYVLSAANEYADKLREVMRDE